MVVLARQRGRARGWGVGGVHWWGSGVRDTFWFERLTATPPHPGHRPPFRFCPLDLETTFSVAAAAFVDGCSSQPTQEEEERTKPRCVEDRRKEGRREESVQLGKEEPVFETACATETRRDKVGWRRRMERRRHRLPSPCGRNSAEPHGDRCRVEYFRSVRLRPSRVEKQQQQKKPTPS